MMDQQRLGALMTAARSTADGLGRIAADKPDATPLHSDAMTFRRIASMLAGLSSEVRQEHATVAQLRRSLQRIAMLEIRGGTELMEARDWKKIVGELQAIAQDALSRITPPAR